MVWEGVEFLEEAFLHSLINTTTTLLWTVAQRLCNLPSSLDYLISKE
jgi:hypothetical protein